MNTFLNGLKEADNYKFTENGGVAHKSTLNKVYDMFALGGAYRKRTDEDCILLFKQAFGEDSALAMKCLFYLADCRGGQGERRFFRVCFNWLAKNYPNIANANIKNVPIFRRWDDILYSCVGTPIESDALCFIKDQLLLDMECETPSLLAKWLPSENASSPTTIRMGNIVRSYLGFTHKEYRKTLAELRSRINVLEKLMSENRWDEIKFDKIPSKAGLIYKNAFATNDITKRRYEEFIKSKETKVNAGTLYPYEIVGKIISGYHWSSTGMSEVDRLTYEKYWNNLPDYFNGKQSNMLCVVDTSGSMTGSQVAAPINIAISLGIYCGERAGGPFQNHYISFSSIPQLIEIDGVDFVDKVRRIYKTNLCDSTNLTGVFDLLLDIADRPDTKEEDIPETICVISDMEIDDMAYPTYYRSTNNFPSWTADNASTEMEKVRKKWANHGHKLPRLVYWNVDARQNTILDSGDSVTFVSGASPAIFEAIITGKNGIDLMLEKLMSSRYESVI